MKKQHPYLKRVIKEQMLQPMRKCHLYNLFCRFAVPGYCLEQFHQFACEGGKVMRKEGSTFGEKKLLLSMCKDEK